MATEMLPVLKKDEKVSQAKEVTPDGNSVVLDCTIQDASTGTTYAARGVRLDFSNCSQADILRLAAAKAIAAYQMRAKVAWRKADGSTDRAALGRALAAENWKVIDVKSAIVDTERRAMTPVEREVARIQKLSAAEREALLKALATFAGGSN